MAMNLALLGKLLSGWNQLKDIRLGDASATNIAELGLMFGYELDPSHSALVSSLLANEDPEITFGDFINNGGLLRLVTGNREQAALRTIRCRHCDELQVV